MRRLLMLCAAACVVGCASLTTLPPQLQPRMFVQVAPDRFAGMVAFNGIEKTFPGDRFNRFELRSWIAKDGGLTHQLYVSDYYEGSWRFYDQAAGEDARTLEFTEISRDVIACGELTGCSMSEIFGADLPDSLLRAHTAGGYAVKFYAKSGDTLVVHLAPEQITKQLAAIDSVRHAK